MNWKGLLLGVALIILVGFGGLVYRNAVEHPSRPITCPLDAKLCPDGTAVARTGLSCTFAACPPPNVTLANIDISFALPTGFVSATPPDSASVAAYDLPPPAPLTMADRITIRRYAIAASTTALATIQKTAIGGASGEPVSATAFSSKVLGTHRFTVVSIERFEGVIDTAYYLARGTDVLRFDATDHEVFNWTDPGLDITILPAHQALVKLLVTLQGE